MITVVDDDPSVRKALSRLIRSAGLCEATYESAEAFLAANVLTECDCLVLDVNLPGKNGLELQAELVASGRSCPIVFITAHADERTRDQAIENGAVDFLRKPLDGERLLKTIQATLGTEKPPHSGNQTESDQG